MNCHVCDELYNEKKEYETEWRKLYFCDACDHMYIDFLGDEIEYHSREYRREGGQAYRKEIHSERLINICKKRCDYVKNYPISNIGKKQYSCYEVGSGGGTFARAIDEYMSGEYVCNEVAPVLIEECERLGFKTDQVDINDIQFDKQYDFIFAWHVLEHIKNFEPLAEKIRDAVKSYFIIEVPTNNLRKVGGKTSWDGHSHYFSHKSFRLFFEKIGFDILDMREGIQTKPDRPSILSTMRKK